MTVHYVMYVGVCVFVFCVCVCVSLIDRGPLPLAKFAFILKTNNKPGNSIADENCVWKIRMMTDAKDLRHNQRHVTNRL